MVNYRLVGVTNSNKRCLKIVHLKLNILLKVGFRVAHCRKISGLWDHGVGIIQYGGAHDSRKSILLINVMFDSTLIMTLPFVINLIKLLPW